MIERGRMPHQGDRLELVMLGEADEGAAIAAVVDHDAAHSAYQLGLVVGSKQHAVSRAQGAQCAIQAQQLAAAL